MAETYRLDPSHSTLGFTAKHMVVTTVRGAFTEFSGQIDLADADDPTSASAEVVIKTASVSSGQADRDNHLRGADFFDVERYPEMRFTSTSVEKLGGDRYRVHGNLTIKDVTRPVELTAETAVAPVPDPWGNERTIISLTGDINRKDWGLTWNMALEAGAWLVSDRIRLELEAVAVKPAAVAA